MRGLTKDINQKITQAIFNIPSNWKEKYNLKDQERTCFGPLSIIFGTDCLQYFPKKVSLHQGVQLEESFFDRKYMLSGRAERRLEPADRAAVCNRLQLHPIDQKWLDIMNPAQRFVGVGLCEKHKNRPSCVECKSLIQTRTRLQLNEERLLEKCLHFNEEQKHWEMRNTPYKSSIQDVPTYEEETKAFMGKLRRKLQTEPNGLLYAQSLDETVKNNLEKGIWKWEEDLIKENPGFESLQSIKSPVNYSLKDSDSHAVRLVHNLSFTRGGKPSLNEGQLTGSSLNHKLHLILLRERSFKFSASNDIKRFYNKIYMSVEDQRRHSFYWKTGGILSEEPWRILCSRVLLFGARMSQYLSNSAKLQTSRRNIEPVSKEIHADICFSYTDDISIHSNESLEDLARRKKIAEDGLVAGGFDLKGWKTSYDEEKDEEEDVGAVLGLRYRASTDQWSIKATLNFSTKVRNLRDPKFEICNRKDLSEYIRQNGLTKRNALQAAHSLFDPLLILLPVKAQLSLAYRELLIRNPDMDYNDYITSPEELKVWETVIGFLLDSKKVKIRRSALPDTFDPVESELSLCIFTDGGQSASVNRIWLRCSLPAESGGPRRFAVHNLYNTFRLGSLNNSGAPRSEVAGLLSACRNAEITVKILDHLKFKSIHIFTDSTVCLGALQAYSSKLKLFFSERALEIQDIVRSHNIETHLISTSRNNADIGTKQNLTDNPILSEAYWTCDFLTRDRDTWGVKDYVFQSEDISTLVNPRLVGDTAQCFTITINDFVSDLISRFNFQKTVNIISCYFQWKPENRGNLLKSRELARQFLFSLAPPSADQISGLGRQYLIESEGKKTFLLTRPFKLGDRSVQKRLLLVDGKSVVGRQIIRSYHQHCSDTSRELARMSDSGLLITNARSYLRKIQSECKRCKRIRLSPAEELIGDNIQKEASELPPYFTSYADCWGPVKVRLKRGHCIKAWVLSLTCVWSRHFSMTLLTDLSSDSFLSGILAITGLLGGAIPQYLYSDFGTNITSLRKLEGEDVSEEQNDKMMRNMKATFRSNNISLLLSSPRAPWRQGLVERLHSTLKLSLKRSNLYNQAHSITKWNHILARQSQVINDRIINLKYNGETLTYLSPNKLIFGSRQGIYPRRIELNLTDNQLYENLNRLENQLMDWQETWNFSYLREQEKFTVFKRRGKTLEKGDIVLINDHKNKTTGYPVLARIKEILSNRTFRLEYIKKEAQTDKDGRVTRPATKSLLTRPKQNLIFITSASEEVQNLDPFSPLLRLNNQDINETDDVDNETDEAGSEEVDDNTGQEDEVGPDGPVTSDDPEERDNEEGDDVAETPEVPGDEIEEEIVNIDSDEDPEEYFPVMDKMSVRVSNPKTFKVIKNVKPDKNHKKKKNNINNE